MWSCLLVFSPVRVRALLGVSYMVRGGQEPTRVSQLSRSVKELPAKVATEHSERDYVSDCAGEAVRASPVVGNGHHGVVHVTTF